MAVKVRVPTPLMKLTDNKSEVTAEGSNISEILNNLESQFVGIKERICEDDGTPRRFINIYLNEDDIRFLHKCGANGYLIGTAIMKNDNIEQSVRRLANSI